MRAISKKLDLAPTVNFEDFVTDLEGYSGADLQAYLYNAHLCCIHEHMEGLEIDSDQPSDADASESQSFVLLGQEQGDYARISKRVN